MKVAIITAHDAGYDELASVTLPVLERYASKHGYALFYDNRIPPTEKDACKARIYRELYASGEFAPDDICMWIDTDAIVMNSAQVVYSPDPGKHFLWAFDFNGPNSGVWIARFSPQAHQFISVYSNTQAAMGWGDNTAMDQKMLFPPFRDWVTCVPGKKMNAYPYNEYGIGHWAHKNEINNYEDGDWIVHFAGIESTRRLQLAREFASKAI